jgi:hypothetical protein
MKNSTYQTYYTQPDDVIDPLAYWKRRAKRLEQLLREVAKDYTYIDEKLKAKINELL